MKWSRIISVLSVFCGMMFSVAFGQCPNDNIDFGDLTPTPAGAGASATFACVWGGDYYTVDVCSSATYRFTTCNSGASSFDTQLTLYDDTGGGLLGYNDDDCGLLSTIDWTATFTGTVRILVDEYQLFTPCSNGTTCAQLDVIQLTPCGGASTGPGDSCSAPIQVVCGDTLRNETTIGNTNAASVWPCISPIVTPGEDRFYEIVVTDPNVTEIRVTLDSVFDNDTYMEVILIGASCDTNACINSGQVTTSTGLFGSGLPSRDFSVPGAGTYYFVIDSQGDGVTEYDIVFECLISGISLDLDGCPGPPADADSNGVQVSWLGVNSPSGVTPGDTGLLCFTLYIENPGWEWLKYVDFEFGSCWLTPSAFSPDAPPNNNGFYATGGNWEATYDTLNNQVSFEFTHNVNPIWGDGNSNLQNCARYRFCMQARIDSACSVDSDLDVVIFLQDDGFGASGISVPSSEFSLATFTLPVELGAFEAYQMENSVKLHWETLSEQNNQYFLIERSGDGSHFTKMGTKESLWKTGGSQHYFTTDPAPLPGANFYRLTQIDRNGDSHVLGTRRVDFQITGKVSVENIFPNPTTDDISLQWWMPEAGEVTAEVLGLRGEILATLTVDGQAGRNSLAIPVDHLESGLYFFRLNVGGERFIQRFVRK